MMTKWICMACVKPCLLETDWESVDPKVCVMGLYNSECTNWKRDCTEEIGAAKFKMTYTYKELDKKVQDLITAGQGQMNRIQELERKYKEHIPKLYKADENIRDEIWDLRTRIKVHAKVIHELKCKVWGS